MSPIRNDLFEKPIGNSLVLAFTDEYGLPDVDHACCLEGVAVDVWNLLKEGLDEGCIVRILSSEYSVDLSVLESDVRRCLNEFAEKRFIENGRQ